MKAQPIRIFIADDHALMRVGLRSMLGLEPDLEIVGEAADGEDAIRQVCALRPDVVIMDLMMPKANGVEATRAILQDLPDTKIVILTSFGTSDELRRAVAHGAVGVQPKEDPTENLITSIRTVMRGETAFPPEVKRMLDAEPPPNPLTDKQAELLRLVMKGQTDKQIADAFGISDSGVKKHLKLIFAKLGATNRTEAAAIALRNSLLNERGRLPTLFRKPEKRL